MLCNGNPLRTLLVLHLSSKGVEKQGSKYGQEPAKFGVATKEK